MSCTEKRPGGQKYQARKDPVVMFFEGDWPDDASAVVLRMDRHSREEARQMVIEEGKKHDIELVNSGTFGWWRQSMRDREPCWIYDDAKGMPGWFFNVE